MAGCGWLPPRLHFGVGVSPVDTPEPGYDKNNINHAVGLLRPGRSFARVLLFHSVGLLCPGFCLLRFALSQESQAAGLLYLGWLPRVLGSCLLRFALSLWVGLLCVPGGCLLRFALSHACCGFACALVGCLLGLSVSLYNCKLHGAFCQGFSSVRSWLRLVDQISLALVSPCGPYVPFNPEALLCAKGDLAFVCICAVVLIDLASCVRYV